MNLVPFKAIYPNLSLVSSPDSFFGSVKSQFSEYQASGFFKAVEEDSIYIYQLETRGIKHQGVISCTDIDDVNKGKMLKHENTIATKEQNMMNLTLQNKALVKPVLLAYDRVIEIDQLIKKVIKKNDIFYSVEFESTGEVHTVWKVSSEKLVNEFITTFKYRVPISYIADGHHRVKTCQLLNATSKKNEVVDTRLKSVLSLYFSWDQLDIFDYNRSVDAFHNLSPLKFMSQLSEYCKIKPLKSAKKPQQKHEMTMLLYGEWYRLKWRKSIIKKHKDEEVIFDTHLLNKHIIENLLDIENVREDTRMKYIDGVVGLAGLADYVHENENRVGFCMYPITAKDVKTIADHNKTLPPKSTWFEPRVKNGLLVQGF
ncbi:MAG: hypothetical protein ACI86M_001280 [Saprospiraceae bacterium]|jgi:uncharacterized protein (DUF1015 family)